MEDDFKLTGLASWYAGSADVEQVTGQIVISLEGGLITLSCDDGFESADLSLTPRQALDIAEALRKRAGV